MQPTYQNPTAQLAVSNYMSKVYLWMTIGILATAAMATYVSSQPEILMAIVTNKILFYGMIIAEFGLVIWLSAGINRMSAAMATSMFLIYAGINGATLSVLSLIYTAESIQSAFMTTAFGFAGLSAFGFVTKRDLGPVGSFCSMGLFGLVGFSIITLFFPSLMGSVASQVYGLVGIVVFAGLTAYDTQAIKKMAPDQRDGEKFQKGAIMGALKLYLDFVNLFIFILRMTGNRRK
ncbi:MAG: Bax inhibitor-1/YccA family protein [Bacteriovoracaceae bacterium]|nr:Bax inhibitor-1/YccA family protein [Bacteriovoracaceae bacterium]